jgi:hypothetical protein
VKLLASGSSLTLGTPADVTLQELRIETFFPADAPSEKGGPAWRRNQCVPADVLDHFSLNTVSIARPAARSSGAASGRIAALSLRANEIAGTRVK